jgi:copper chaperone NosL
MKKSKLIMIVSALMLLALFIFPLWNIALEAPQYPDPIGMNIWINKITDQEPNDIKNINLMNHYVGMKEIPEDLPEFEIFPPVVIGMTVLGLIIGFLGKRKLYVAWFVIMAILGTAGMYDFYLWEYDYGHNLSETAAIKFMDEAGKPMAYQPPLIGNATILNFVAKSWPQAGAYFLFAGMLMSLVAFYVDKKRIGSVMRNLLLLLGLSFTLLACEIKPAEINYGADGCSFCTMTIVDNQHAAQLVSDKGKVFKYDAIECMLNDLKARSENEIGMLLVNDYNTPGELVNALEATYLISESIPSPMGAFLSAGVDSGQMASLKEVGGGDLYTWTSLKKKFQAD